MMTQTAQGFRETIQRAYALVAAYAKSADTISIDATHLIAAAVKEARAACEPWCLTAFETMHPSEREHEFTGRLMLLDTQSAVETILFMNTPRAAHVAASELLRQAWQLAMLHELDDVPNAAIVAAGLLYLMREAKYRETVWQQIPGRSELQAAAAMEIVALGCANHARGGVYGHNVSKYHLAVRFLRDAALIQNKTPIAYVPPILEAVADIRRVFDPIILRAFQEALGNTVSDS